MPIKIKCTIDAHQVRAGLEALGKESPRAQMRAINRTLTTVHARAIRDIAADLGVKQKDLRHAGRDRGVLTVYRASTQSLTGSIQGTGSRIPVYDFGAKDTADKLRRRAAKRGGSAKAGQGVTWKMQGQLRRDPHAFIARMASGHVGVFKRKGRKAFPIRELFGPSVPHVFRKHIKSALKAVAESELAKNLRHEIGYLLTFGRR